MTATELLERLDEALPRLTWRRLDPPPEAAQDPSTRFYQGVGSGWAVTLAEFEIKDTGPRGELRMRGFDGAAVREGTVLRLPRDHAERACAAARKALP